MKGMIEMLVRKSRYDAAVTKAAHMQQLWESRGKVIETQNATIGERDRELQWARAELNLANARTAEAQSRLARILAMETPGMANVGKRMIRAARGE